MMTRPWNPIVNILSTIIPDVYHWKAKAENYLRKSGINYAIVRPSGLVGEESNTTLTPYQVDQGDTLNGRITRFTVAKIINEVLQSKEVPAKVTFECTGC